MNDTPARVDQKRDRRARPPIDPEVASDVFDRMKDADAITEEAHAGLKEIHDSAPGSELTRDSSGNALRATLRFIGGLARGTARVAGALANFTLDFKELILHATDQLLPGIVKPYVEKLLAGLEARRDRQKDERDDGNTP
jgi:hypothetical protein